MRGIVTGVVMSTEDIYKKKKKKEILPINIYISKLQFCLLLANLCNTNVTKKQTSYHVLNWRGKLNNVASNLLQTMVFVERQLTCCWLKDPKISKKYKHDICFIKWESLPLDLVQLNLYKRLAKDSPVYMVKHQIIWCMILFDGMKNSSL